MTNLEQVTAWHENKPAWAEKFTARDWDTADLVARKLDAAAGPEPVSCTLSTIRSGGFRYCTLQAGHDGPCREFPVEE